MNFLHKIFSALCVAATASAFGAAPSQYYISCENKNGQNLLSAVHNVIKNHTTLSYSSLNTYYPETDAYPDGTLWDIYSTKHWPTSQKCGNYSSLGDCYNKEHSMPKSWFDDASPMYSDLMHLYPTDGKVNGQRSNYPYGECAKGTSVAAVGSWKALGKLGACTFSGYTGTVFEPDDEYKGDLARTYFYMAACYYDKIKSWNSPMLAGNNFPAFSGWALNLLLKWHRQDPVSDRETTRNDAVYKYQGNRNPFIDHPDMVEYIWGNKSTASWTAAGSEDAIINQPVNGSTVDMGLSGVGVAVSREIVVRTTYATDVVTLSATGNFSVSPARVEAAAANTGSTVTISYKATATGKHTGLLTVACGDVASTVNLKGETVSGIPTLDASEVSSEGFTANWVYVGDDKAGKYTLTIADSEGTLPAYPLDVDAKSGKYAVKGLMPSIDYTYTLSGQSMTSTPVSVRTADLIPLIDFLFDGDLFFTTAPGEPSEAAEILMNVENIDSDITVSVDEPFELSTDKATWSTSLLLSPDESRIYLRLFSATSGTFESTLRAKAGDYTADDAIVRGSATLAPSFIEDFEATGAYSTYSDQTYEGTATTWNLSDAGIWSSDKEHHSGAQALRCGKTNGSKVEMAADRMGGIGTVSFWCCRWSDADGDATVLVETSADGGKTWQEKGRATVDSDSFKEYSVFCGIPAKGRMRLRQIEGKRFFVDDIAITDQSTGLTDPTAARHTWDAYSRNGALVVSVKTPEGVDVAIYSIDGITLFNGHLAQGEHSFAAQGICIVASGNFSRTVLVPHSRRE